MITSVSDVLLMLEERHANLTKWAARALAEGEASDADDYMTRAAEIDFVRMNLMDPTHPKGSTL